MSILTSVLSISLISVVLAIIISVADHFLNNYGICEIDINQGERKISVTGGASLLTSLASEKIFLPSACGGKATCGLCKIRVQSGAGPLLPTEEPYISEAERKENVRLACQVKVKQNLAVKIPAELFNIREYVTTLEQYESLTHDIKGLLLRLPPGETIQFVAGQYMQLHTKPYDTIKESVFRAYSIASPPSQTDSLYLIVRLVPEGLCTGYVHTQLKEGDEVTLSGPYGDFRLHGDQGNDLVMIAGGSGLAPIRSLILDILEKKLDYTMTFFFGAVSRRDLYDVEEFEKLAEEHKNFRYIPALSKPAPEDNWSGETGLITDVVDRHVPDGVNREAYLCGSPGMINACLAVLSKKGIGEDRVYYDKF